MLKSESLSNVFAAFVAAQAELPSITRSKTVKVTTRTGGSYNFKYAPLDAVIDVVKPIYARHGLSVTQLLSVNGIETFVLHESGEYFGSTFPIEDYLTKRVKEVVDGQVRIDHEPIGPQEVGSIVTYLKRYAYGAINHLALDDDDDANGPSGNTVEDKTPQRPAHKPKAPTTPPSKTATKPTPPKAPAPAEPEEPQGAETQESPFESSSAWVIDPWDEVYEAKLTDYLTSFSDVPSMMKGVQDIMAEVEAAHGIKKKEEWRGKYQPSVVKAGQVLANR